MIRVLATLVIVVINNCDCGPGANSFCDGWELSLDFGTWSLGPITVNVCDGCVEGGLGPGSFGNCGGRRIELGGDEEEDDDKKNGGRKEK